MLSEYRISPRHVCYALTVRNGQNRALRSLDFDAIDDARSSKVHAIASDRHEELCTSSAYRIRDEKRD